MRAEVRSELLRVEMFRRGMGVRRFACELGVSVRSLYRVLGGEMPGALVRDRMQAGYSRSRGVAGKPCDVVGVPELFECWMGEGYAE